MWSVLMGNRKCSRETGVFYYVPSDTNIVRVKHYMWHPVLSVNMVDQHIFHFFNYQTLIILIFKLCGPQVDTKKTYFYTYQQVCVF